MIGPCNAKLGVLTYWKLIKISEKALPVLMAQDWQVRWKYIYFVWLQSDLHWQEKKYWYF
jgi:hypothetical protein